MCPKTCLASETVIQDAFPMVAHQREQSAIARMNVVTIRGLRRPKKEFTVALQWSTRQWRMSRSLKANLHWASKGERSVFWVA